MAQAVVSHLKTTCIRPVLISADTMMAHWVFDDTSAAGVAVRFQALAWPRWHGDLIMPGQFFYDPAQLTQRRHVPPRHARP